MAIDSKDSEAAEPPYGANEIRLNGRQWCVAAGVVLLVVLLVPRLWPRLEKVPFEKDFRVPYELSQDYWLYDRWLRDADADADADTDADESVYLVGDSVIWGEYVSRNGTLSAFLNQESGPEVSFVNAGVNGLFPLALEGLVQYFGNAMQDRRVLLHCNLLWLTSPEADLSAEKEQVFNHPRLVPQFSPSIPSYRASFDERLGVVVGRSIGFLGWVNHLQNAYLGQQGFYEWTLADDGDYPPSYPNTYKMPLEAISLSVAGEQEPDPDRGLTSPRHKAWSTTGQGSQNFEWVPLEQSLQWAAFRRLVRLLQGRGNELVVVIGPLNRHIMAAANQARFDERLQGARRELAEMGVRVIVPQVLSFELYGDASHPLTEGYRQLAVSLWQHEVFREWLTAGQRD